MVNSYLEFLKIADRRALKLSPSHKQAWQNAFNLQRLLKRRQSSRFEYLYAHGKFDATSFKSLDSISERLDKGWTDAEEVDLTERMAAYRHDSRAIEEIQSNGIRMRSTMCASCWRMIRNIGKRGLSSQIGLGN